MRVTPLGSPALSTWCCNPEQSLRSVLILGGKQYFQLWLQNLPRQEEERKTGKGEGKKGKQLIQNYKYFSKRRPQIAKTKFRKKYPLRSGLLHVHCASSTGVCDHSSLDIRANSHENFQTRAMSLCVPQCGRPSAIFLQIFHIKGSLRSWTDLCGERHMQDHPDVEEGWQLKAASPTGNRRGWCGVECLVDQDDQHIMLREGFTERVAVLLYFVQIAPPTPHPPSPQFGPLVQLFLNTKNIDLSDIQNDSLPKILLKGRILAFWVLYTT